MSNRAAVIIALAVAFVAGLTIVTNTIAFLIAVSLLTAWVMAVHEYNETGSIAFVDKAVSLFRR